MASGAVGGSVPRAATRSWRRPAWLGLLLVALTFAAYLPVLRCGFIWDDAAYVTENELLSAPDGLRRIWFSQHTQSQYFPLVFTVLRIEYGLWGEDPLGYHAVNVLLHALDAVLLWILLARLAVPGAWLAAAVWALHPVNVESVAWVTELKNTLSTLFCLLALLAWLRFTERESAPRWRWYALTLALHVLALLGKTTACTLPAPLLLIPWMQGQRIDRRRWLQVAPFVLLGLAFGLLSIWWERHLGNYQTDVGVSLTALERLLLAARALWFYAGKLVWPANLAFSYPRWEIGAGEPALVMALAGVIAVAALLWWRRAALGRPALAAVAFFAATLSPLLGFIPLYTFLYTFVADHYQYVASIGLVALAVGALTRAARRAGLETAARAAAALVLLVLGTLTWRQARAYESPETLWRDTLAKNPASWMAHTHLGNLLLKAGRNAEAVEHYRAALALRPDDAEAHGKIATALAQAGEVHEAIEHLRTALTLEPDSADMHFTLGHVLARAQRTAEAIPEYQRALELDPGHYEAHNNLGNLLKGAGRVPEAIAHFERALELRPEAAETRYNLGLTLAGAGRLQQALAQYERALVIRPDFALAHQQLGLILQRLGKTAEAEEHFAAARRINPKLGAAPGAGR